MRTSLLSLSLAVAAAAQLVTAFDNKIFLIRHGEKPSDDNTPGLSSQGMQRAQCLRNVFGASSSYNIGYILTQDYKSDGSRERPYDTVKPLADDLGLKIDHSCDRDDEDCAKDAVNKYAASHSKNILICWEHDELGKIGDALGGKFDYPSSHFDYIYEIYHKDLTSNSPFSEHCSGLDS